MRIGHCTAAASFAAISGFASGFGFSGVGKLSPRKLKGAGAPRIAAFTFCAGAQVDDEIAAQADSIEVDLVLIYIRKGADVIHNRKAVIDEPDRIRNRRRLDDAVRAGDAPVVRDHHNVSFFLRSAPTQDRRSSPRTTRPVSMPRPPGAP